MQVFDSLAAFRQVHNGCAATIGKYDGLHLGHQAILRSLRAEAEALGLPTLVVLSEPQPEEFFAGAAAPPRLTHFDDKVELLREFGIDCVFRLHFDEALSQCTAEDFVHNILVEGLGMKSLVVGHDFRFGRGRGGDINLLRKAGRQQGFRVHEEPPLCLDGERISSTLVRSCLAAGNLAKVGRLLGRDYSIAGEVIRGRQLGRQLGCPTANVALHTESLPLTGVYAVRARWREQDFPAVANIGYRPTVEQNAKPSLEVHLFDFDGDLYGCQLQVSFLQKLREEEKFDSLDILRQRIAADMAQARAWFRGESLPS